MEPQCLCSVGLLLVYYLVGLLNTIFNETNWAPTEYLMLHGRYQFVKPFKKHLRQSFEADANACINAADWTDHLLYGFNMWLRLQGYDY